MKYLIALFILASILNIVIVYGDAPPPPSPPDELINVSQRFNLSNIVNFYYREFWGPISIIVVLLVPVSIFIKSRSLSIAVASLAILMGLINALSSEPLIRYIALLSTALATAVMIYRLMYNPEKQPQEI